MTLSNLFVDLSLLRTNPDFRRVLIARTISLMALGLLSVAVPLQVYALTGSSLQVGMAAACDGVGMFLGLLLGGVLADRMDRRRLILVARSLCGLGFLGLAANAALPSPSLPAIYALSFWDGFFGAIGVNALMAAMPHLVGRANLVQARALGMLSMRVATILSPALGGLLIAGLGVGWVYLLTALGTGLTVLTLLGLPRMMPQGEAGENPLRAMAQAFAFLAGHKVILSVAALGCLTTVVTSIRILFPALVDEAFGGGAFETGLMYSAVPIGATLGAALSGWGARLERPGLAMGGACMGAFACVAVIGAAGSLPNGFYVALPVLVLFGYATSIASLLEYSMVQGHTPDRLLGRVNSLWTAQDVFGDSAGTIGMGLLATLLSPAVGILALGLGALALAAAVTATATTMRGAPMSDPALEGNG
ncbi:enterobactin transporter EntS (plasmid) [Azospirillum brasilense]|uniref:Multidrug efflux pump Tap n=1 Tax=Azospirillum brasilense TaxID=192 RepID=A0A0P0EKB6_AZOBR|nr:MULTISPECIES: enterobactin transporter EntS [Azospirillum]ALJ38398.1 POT family transporter [Azospirillum brasilense]MDW7554242.1 enterobactin transporter EntS [Azospirillum brasilense]MDW7594459.1 enterobactin transporter EntS [Azospirillum brasilense]MDW7629313.1 enterobactin transporter EntS [Azospirillum brasilense]MDW7630033.1 enterobactin transporter EntS [Azospirillum brasilense]